MGTDSVAVGVAVYTLSYRGAIISLLQADAGLLPLDLGDGGEETHRQLIHSGPDVLLLDLPRRKMAALVRSARESNPEILILALNCDETEEELLSLFEAGLSGFIPHNAGAEEMLGAIWSGLHGEFSCPPKMAAALVRRLHSVNGQRLGIAIASILTTRENQVVRHMEEGLSNKQIAERLHIEHSTVKNHVHNILHKLDAHRRTEAVHLLQRSRSS